MIVNKIECTAMKMVNRLLRKKLEEQTEPSNIDIDAVKFL